MHQSPLLVQLAVNIFHDYNRIHQW